MDNSEAEPPKKYSCVEPGKELNIVTQPRKPGSRNSRALDSGFRGCVIIHSRRFLSSLKARMSRAHTSAENMKARNLPPGSHISIGSFPVISSPSLGHENLPEVCRIHSSILKGIMTRSRLHLRRSTLLQGRVPIRFPPCSTHDRSLQPNAVPPLPPLLHAPCVLEDAGKVG